MRIHEYQNDFYSENSKKLARICDRQYSSLFSSKDQSTNVLFGMQKFLDCVWGLVQEQEREFKSVLNFMTFFRAVNTLLMKSDIQHTNFRLKRGVKSYITPAKL